MRVICCLCNKVKTPHGWVDMYLPSSEELSHGYCPICYEKMVEHIASRAPTEPLCRTFKSKPV